MKPKVICNKRYKCKYPKKCDHRDPHQPYDNGCDQLSGGTSLYCNYGKMKSICVPIIDGRYSTSEIKYCSCGEPKCNASWAVIMSRSIEELPE